MCMSGPASGTARKRLAAPACPQVSSALAGQAAPGQPPPPPQVLLQVRDAQGAVRDYNVPRAVRCAPPSNFRSEGSLACMHTLSSTLLLQLS